MLRLRVHGTLAALTLTCAAAHAGSLAYVTKNNSLRDLELSMSDYYLVLDRKHELPVQRVQDDIGMTVQDLMYALGLIRGRSDSAAFPNDLTQLLCRLNPRTCRAKPDGQLQWVNKQGDVVCLPAVSWQDALTFVRTKVPASPDAAAALERQFGTCTALGEKCQSRIDAAARQPDRDGSVRVVGLAQAARTPDADAPKTCEDAPVKPASLLIDSSKWDNLPCAHDCSRPKLYRARQERVLDARAVGALPSPAHESSRTASSSAATRAPAAASTAAAAAGSSAAREAGGDHAEALRESLRSFAPDATLSSAARRASRAEVAAARAAPPPPPPPTPAAAPPPMPAVTAEESAPAPAAATSAAPEPAAAAPAAATPTPGAAEESGATVVNLAGLDNPFLTAADLLERRKPDADEHTIGVLVFDTEINACHPVLRRAARGQHCRQALPTAFSMLSHPTLADHGTHVSGLIAGDYGLGVHPGASLFSVPLESDASVTTFGVDQEQQVVAALAEARNQTRVANFSINLNAQDRQLSATLAQQFANLRHILFVAAAGDSRGPLSNDCDVLPACLSLGTSANLIVVGGAQLVGDKWQLWPDSASGVRVDLLAPAVEALSAVMQDGWLATMKGTSQSAALVSGLAARLFERTPPPSLEWAPSQVRNRLMATARFQTQIIGLSGSGVVDGDRALETERQVLVRKVEDGQQVVLHGKLFKVFTPPNDGTPDSGVRFYNPARNDSQTYDFCRLYRLSRLGPENKWVLAYDWPGPNAQGRWIKADIIPGAIMDKTPKVLRFQVDGAPEPTDVPLNDVIEFYDAFSGSPAC